MREKDLIYKDPDARLDYLFNWEDWMIGEDEISTVELFATNCTIDANTVLTDRVIVWVSGGEAGQNGSVRCRITTVQDRKDNRTMTFFFKNR